MDKGQNQYTIQGLVIPVQRSPQIKSPNHPNKTQIKIFTKYCHFLSPCKPSCPSCGKPHKALQQTATMIFCGKSQKNNNIYWFELFTQYKMKANNEQLLKNYTQLKSSGQNHCGPSPIYIHHMYLSCVSNVFPRYIFQPGGLLQVLSVGYPSVPRTLGMLP